MVKFNPPKLTKVHKKVMGIFGKTKNTFYDEASIPLDQKIIRSIEIPPQLNPIESSLQSKTHPEGPNVVFMGVSAVRNYDTKDLPVISLSYEDVSFPNAKEVLRLNFEPGEIHREQCDEVVEFFKKHKDNNFVVHCTYGEQRSRAVAHAIVSMCGQEKRGIWRYNNNTKLWMNDEKNLQLGDTLTHQRIYTAYRRSLQRQESTTE